MKLKIVNPELSVDEFLQLLVNHFPESTEEVLDPDFIGLIHLQLGGFANYTNKCIETKRFDELKKIFIFFEASVGKVHATVENALYVSFLEHVGFKGLNEKEIKTYLSPCFFNIWSNLTGRG